MQALVGKMINLRTMLDTGRLMFEKHTNSVSGVLMSLTFLVAGVVIGWLAWGRGPETWRLAWILLLPVAWGLASGRASASMLIAGYFLAGARGLPGGSVVFFGEDAPVWFGWACWLGACALLSLPFVVLWPADVRARGWRFVVALCVGVVPPLGLIGWCGPVLAAGVVFPGLEWLGLAFMLAMMAALVGRRWRMVAGFSIVAVLANVLAGSGPVAPAGWEGVDTNFSRLSSAGSDEAGQVLAGMRRVAWVQAFAKGVPAGSVRVLPETVLGPINGLTELALQEIGAELTARGSRVLAGGELIQDDGRYKNSVMVLGAQPGEVQVAIQGVPVPISMWKPWADNGAVADVFGRGGAIEVAGMSAGVLVCYEQLLSYSLFWSMLGRDSVVPNVLIAVSNVWWARATSIPAVQAQSVAATGRLFGVAVVSARNF
ncbi:hypothetical protein RCH05_003649 [Janthinobacterium sp. CAN_S7]